MQMYLQAYNSSNYGVFFNIGKVGLALLSIAFDLTLIFQHYVLYRHSHPRRIPRESYPRATLYDSDSGDSVKFAAGHESHHHSDSKEDVKQPLLSSSSVYGAV